MDHPLEVIDVVLEPHPNADTLSIQRLGDVTCVVKTEQWKGVEKAVYISPDGLVDTGKTQFAFLAPKAKSDGWYRIRACKLRGVPSFGLMVPFDGSDLNVRHWNPAEPREEPLVVTTRSGRKISGDPNPIRGPQIEKYDLDNGRRYARERLEIGEEVVVTEKIHGANARFCFYQGQMLCGSRTSWKHEKPNLSVETLISRGVEEDEAKEIIDRLAVKPPSNWWWNCLRNDSEIEQFCRRYPDHVLFGEVYGRSVQGEDFAYDSPESNSFRAFDVMRPDGTMMRFVEREALDWNGVKKVPVLYNGPFDPAATSDLAEGKSTLNSHCIREGVVVESVRSGVKLKWVGVGYLDRKRD